MPNREHPGDLNSNAIKKVSPKTSFEVFLRHNFNTAVLCGGGDWAESRSFEL